ncbi:MAG: small ribosomal subunit Rsm22 family protein, partial [Verrucomicrobiota bacterium]
DGTFAERIGWKWDAVLQELALRQWKPTSRHLLDWGCGTGVASRRVLERWPDQFQSLSLHDRSSAAVRFAADRARREHGKVTLQTGENVTADTLLVISHVINELPQRELDRLLSMACSAREVIWVEAGAHLESRRLSETRDRILSHRRGLVAVAPCTHQAGCGMLAPGNEQHWCHHFAQPPSEIFQSASWHQFSKEMGIDLRSLPYSFLVMERPRETEPTPPGFSRVIGKPREFKGHDKVFSCQQSGVGELMLQKRDAPALMKTLRKGPDCPVFRWETVEGKIVGAEPFVENSSTPDVPE